MTERTTIMIRNHYTESTLILKLTPSQYAVFQTLKDEMCLDENNLDIIYPEDVATYIFTEENENLNI